MLVSMTLTLMQGHIGLAEANNQRYMLSATKQALSIKFAITVGHFFTWPWLCKRLWLDQRVPCSCFVVVVVIIVVVLSIYYFLSPRYDPSRLTGRKTSSRKLCGFPFLPNTQMGEVERMCGFQCLYHTKTMSGNESCVVFHFFHTHKNGWDRKNVWCSLSVPH